MPSRPVLSHFVLASLFANRFAKRRVAQIAAAKRIGANLAVFERKEAQ